MKRHWIEYHASMPQAPMTYWVHREADGKPWRESKVFNPPRQPAVLKRGYPMFFVEYDGFVFEFASLTEIRVAIETLGRRLLPSTIRLTEDRGEVAGWIGPNNHWLSRLPSQLMPWRYRARAVRYLQVALSDFERSLSEAAK